jgi:ABC-type dipeptide/oligopeptide/nickel transport system ATPase subunit
MIVGICGLIGSGKGTVADILVNKHDFQKVSFADSLKDAVSAVFGWPRYMLEGDTESSREFREQVDEWWADKLQMPGLTPRLVLQKWGTEVCRDSWHQDIWILSLERKLSNGNYVIPDTRFPNEIEMIQRLGGEVWCVKRGEDPEWFQKYQSHSIIPNDIHASEWKWAKSHFDRVIENNSTVKNLIENIRNLL